jgi:hypothetical protein
MRRIHTTTGRRRDWESTQRFSCLSRRRTASWDGRLQKSSYTTESSEWEGNIVKRITASDDMEKFVWLNLRGFLVWRRYRMDFDGLWCIWYMERRQILINSEANGQVVWTIASPFPAPIMHERNKLIWKCNFMQPWAFSSADNTSGSLNHSLTLIHVDVWALQCENSPPFFASRFQFRVSALEFSMELRIALESWIAFEGEVKNVSLKFSVSPQALGVPKERQTQIYRSQFS